MSAEFQQAWVEVNLVAAALQHRAAEIVIENHSGLADPVLESMDMAAQKVLHGLIEEELQIQCARVGQSHDETGQRSFGAAHGDMTEMGPVDLCLFGREGVQTEERFARRRTQSGHGAAQLYDTAGIATLSNHLVNAGSTQTRVLVQDLAHELQIGIEDGWAQSLTAMEAIRFNGTTDGILVNAQLAGDGADLPMLGVKIMTNLYMRFWIDHLDLSLDRGIRGKGSTKRPLRPQTMQRKNRGGCWTNQPRTIGLDPGFP
jgi:hypothetical protein